MGVRCVRNGRSEGAETSIFHVGNCGFMTGRCYVRAEEENGDLVLVQLTTVDPVSVGAVLVLTSCLI